jgi:hypothetical protein
VVLWLIGQSSFLKHTSKSFLPLSLSILRSECINLRDPRNIAPGGYLELCDGVFPLYTDDDSYPPNSALQKWGQLIVTAASKLGRPADAALFYKEQMEEAGFVNVVQQVYKWPSNGWPKDKKLKELGMWNYANIGESIGGISMALFTRALGWSAAELEVFLVEVRKEMKNTKIHAYWNM